MISCLLRLSSTDVDSGVIYLVRNEMGEMLDESLQPSSVQFRGCPPYSQPKHEEFCVFINNAYWQVAVSVQEGVLMSLIIKCQIKRIKQLYFYDLS
jgi:hypothetical protein